MRIVKTNNLGNNLYHIIHLQSAILWLVWRIKSKSAVNLKTTHIGIIVTLRIKEHSFDHRLRVFYRSKITRTNTTIYFKQSFTLARCWVFFERCFNIFMIASINLFKSFYDFRLIHTKCSEESRHRQFATAVNFNVNRTIRSRLKLKPRTTARNHLCTVIILKSNRLAVEEHTSRTNKLRHDHAFRTVNYKCRAVSHPRIITKINVLFFFGTGYLVFKLDLHMKRSFIGSKIIFRLLLRLLWLFKIIIFEP